MNTSHQALDRNSATIKGNRELVLAFIKAAPVPPTAREVAERLKAQIPDFHNIPTRCYELCRAGSVERAGRRRCEVSGNMASTFRATGRPYAPPPPPLPNTRSQGLLEAIEEARELARLMPDAAVPMRILTERLQDLMASAPTAIALLP